MIDQDVVENSLDSFTVFFDVIFDCLLMQLLIQLRVFSIDIDLSIFEFYSFGRLLVKDDLEWY